MPQTCWDKCPRHKFVETSSPSREDKGESILHEVCNFPPLPNTNIVLAFASENQENWVFNSSTASDSHQSSRQIKLHDVEMKSIYILWITGIVNSIG